MENPKERIINTSIKLFYSQGYDFTSINQIIDESGTHKASFYRYFSDKSDIGLEYLYLKGEEIRTLIFKLTEKSSSIEEFVKSWAALLKKQSKSGSYFGCPLVRFISGSSIQDEKLREKIRETLKSWMLEIELFCEKLKNRKELKANFQSKQFSKLVVKLFQGNSSVFVITNDLSTWDDFKNEVTASIHNF
ncbi:MAG TPA: TetR/AcrR family transcriptional regulator [Leptospiraceae bacterium]|nr:TetR/AcrR family transcriptional regulator [Leptospiraceae bacterium]HMW05858.1 TetR/AcrR family transcriptional regulator [Leptospiraceae bacterium]HMX33196.1 TetR/AcrR family transcriptional regulator [Leptospiraceae bacterium]HMY33645.1 TetR/AcrR family transcriptional regulator [Leptospiraceae bacterium]HMZ64106.1 TetR/AcrR family transcriptional regulator [Leptospiraceae bacterium]